MKISQIKRSGLTGVFILIFLFLGFYLIRAQQSVSPHFAVSPEKFELEVQRGQHLENEIIIFNKSDVALPIEARILDFTAEENTGTIQFYGGDEREQGIEDISFNSRRWLKIENPNFILDPRERNEIKFSIDIPQSAEPGGHYAVVLFEPKLPSFYFEEGQPKAIPVIGVLFLFSVEVEGLSRLGEPLTVIDFSIPEKLRLKKLENLFGLFSEARAAEKKTVITETGYLPFSLKFKNNDIYHIRPSGNLSILSLKGKLIGESEIKETTILPGKTRAFPVDLKPNLPEIIRKYLPSRVEDFISKNLLFGKFKAQLSLKLENETINKNFEFWVFPWKAGLSTTVIFCLLTLFVVKYRKRISKAIFVLFKK